MDTKKISVLIPMYNRKCYIEDCINSVLNQTFQDFEIVIRDDASTDGVFEFVKNYYAKEISCGKIILSRNDKNIGELLSLRKLLFDAKGKYITILHNDDLYLPNALKILYETAEKFNADVVHCTDFFTSAPDGVIKKGTPVKRISKDRANILEEKIISPNLEDRFNEWLQGGTFQDLQYNIFRRDLIQNNKDYFYCSCCESFFFTLIWLMLARVVVKTPEAVYIRRDSPYSQSNDVNSNIYKFEFSIPMKLKLGRGVDKFTQEFKFFSTNEELKYYVKTRIFLAHESLFNDDALRHGNKEYLKIYKTIEDTFRKYFDADAVYLALLFHWAHLMQFNNGNLQTMLQNCLKLLNRDL